MARAAPHRPSRVRPPERRSCPCRPRRPDASRVRRGGACRELVAKRRWEGHVGAEVTVRPLIGVTTSEVRVPDDVHPLAQSDRRQTEMALGMKYMKAIEEAGGIPVVMPPLDLDEVDPLVERLDGLCLSGGPDMDPGTYGGRYHPQLGPLEPHLDVFELAMTRAADHRGLP